MRQVNDKQVGGCHYKSEYEHWDLIAENRVGYLEGCATKYIVRWRKKGGRKDLEKASHYIEKAMDLLARDVTLLDMPQIAHSQLQGFLNANPHLGKYEKEAIRLLLTWRSEQAFHAAHWYVSLLLINAKEGENAAADLETESGVETAKSDGLTA